MAVFGSDVTREGRVWEDPYFPKDSSVRPKVVEEILQYFQSDQWKQTLDLVLEPGVVHIHNYTDTNLHPVAFENVFVGYMRKMGFQMPKSVSYLGTPNLGGEVWFRPHGRGTTCKFDMKFKYAPENSSVVLRPSTSFEPNLLAWRELDSAQSMGRYEWTNYGPKEQVEVKKYLEESYQWYKVCEMIGDVMVPHFHVRIDTCLHPIDVIAKEFEKEFKKRGFEVESMTPMEWVDTRYDMQELSKIAFKMMKPNMVFDLDWIYTPGVPIRPSKSLEPPIVEFRNENFEETLRVCCRCFRGEILPIVLSQDEYEQIMNNVKKV